MNRHYIKHLLAFVICSVFGCSSTLAQDASDTAEKQTVVLPPLFEFPVAPEELGWTESSNWLTQHFWDPFDFKVQSVGQQQLNHAFETWIIPIRYSSPEVTDKAVDALLKKIEKNPTLLLQFTRAAERSIYDPDTAQIWNDDMYLKFINAILKNKKVSSAYKAKYSRQKQLLENTKVSKPFMKFDYVARTGEKKKFDANGRYAIIEFGDPSCPNCQMARISLVTDDYIKANRDNIDIYFIIPELEEGDISWTQEVMDYPDGWKVGAAELDDLLDIRTSPSFFLVDPSGNLLLKNVNLSTVTRYLQDNTSGNGAQKDE